MNDKFGTSFWSFLFSVVLYSIPHAVRIVTVTHSITLSLSLLKCYLIDRPSVNKDIDLSMFIVVYIKGNKGSVPHDHYQHMYTSLAAPAQMVYRSYDQGYMWPLGHPYMPQVMGLINYTSKRVNIRAAGFSSRQLLELRECSFNRTNLPWCLDKHILQIWKTVHGALTKISYVA